MLNQFTRLKIEKIYQLSLLMVLLLKELISNCKTTSTLFQEAPCHRGKCQISPKSLKLTNIALIRCLKIMKAAQTPQAMRAQLVAFLQ